MGQLAQYTLNGLMAGSIYALIALGLVTVFKATRVLNFAHGYIIMCGAYFYYTFAVLLPQTGWMPEALVAWRPEWLVQERAALDDFSPRAVVLDWLVSAPRVALGLVGAVICNALLGLAIERALMRPLLGRPPFAMVMVTVGLISILSGLTHLIWTADAAFVPPLAPNAPIRFDIAGAPIFVFAGDLANMALSLLIFAGIVLMVRLTRMGVAIRATAEDQVTAYAVGIRVPRVVAGAWMLASVTGAVAGAILASRNGISPSLGLFGFSVLAILLMGGLDSYAGVFVASLAVGVLEALAQWQLGGDWAGILPFILVLVVLLLRPQGLGGSRKVERI
jgi:branched-chain amino acid transport system permease protein